MYIRPCYRTKDGKRHAYWSLVESVRTERGPRQRVVAYLGQMDAEGRLGVERAAEGHSDIQRRLGQQGPPQWVTVDARWIRVERCLEFGGPWLGRELLRQLGLVEFLAGIMPAGQEEIAWSVMAEVLVLSRFCQPSSELYIAEHFYRQTAMEDLLGVSGRKVNDQRLYRAMDHLLPHKEALETHLKARMGELFQLEYDLLLYDVTSTYFEGQAARNPQAKRGYSLVCFLAYVLWKTLGQLCRRAGLGDEPRKVLDELARLRVVDVVMPTRSGPEIRKRCITRPTDHQAILLQRLGFHLPSRLDLADEDQDQM